jgi:hypothetical protein
MKISIELANAILNYLASRPYIEVAKLINEIQAHAPKPEENKTPTKDSKAK